MVRGVCDWGGDVRVPAVPRGVRGGPAGAGVSGGRDPGVCAGERGEFSPVECGEESRAGVSPVGGAWTGGGAAVAGAAVCGVNGSDAGGGGVETSVFYERDGVRGRKCIEIFMYGWYYGAKREIDFYVQLFASKSLPFTVNDRVSC